MPRLADRSCSRCCSARTRSASCAPSAASPLVREYPPERDFVPQFAESRAAPGRDSPLPRRPCGRRLGMIESVAPPGGTRRGRRGPCGAVSSPVPARCRSSRSRSSRVRGNVRPSPFFVFAGWARPRSSAVVYCRDGGGRRPVFFTKNGQVVAPRQWVETGALRPRDWQPIMRASTRRGPVALPCRSIFTWTI